MRFLKVSFRVASQFFNSTIIPTSRCIREIIVVLPDKTQSYMITFNKLGMLMPKLASLILPVSKEMTV